MLPRLGRWLVVLAALLAAAPAGAYCRTRTCEFRRNVQCALEPGTGCSLDGPYVFWPDSCIPFAVQRDGSARDGFSAALLETLIEDGFRVWSEVPCPRGGSPELAAASQGPIACDEVEYDCQERESNSNVMLFRDDFVDANPGLHLGVIALTTLTANTRTGEIFDADMEINTRDEDFVLEGAEGIADGELSLRGVVYHELGHLLGLSHSWVEGALMRAAYEGNLEPGEDDIEGICAASIVSDDDPNCVTAPLGADTGCVGHDVSCTTSRAPLVDERGCACGLAGAAAEGSSRWLGLGWAAGALLFGRLRRSRRSRSVL